MIIIQELSIKVGTWVAEVFPTGIPFGTPIGMFEGFRYHLFFQQFESHCYSILEEPKKIQLL